MPSAHRSENVVLSRVEAEDYAAIAPNLVEQTVCRGEVLIHQFDEVQTVHFPISAALSNSLTFADGRVLEATAVGRDGLSGLAAFLAESPIAWDVVCQIPGTVLALDVAIMRSRFKASEHLRTLLLRVTHENQSQAAQNIACAKLHEVTPRLARWLLTLADRTGRNEFELTQDEMALQLGAQRSTVNIAANDLRTAGGLKYSRARLQIADRPSLERSACDCYRQQVDKTRRLGLSLPKADPVKEA